MSRTPPTDKKSSASQGGKLLQSGILFSAISFLTGLGNLAFQGVLGRHLKASGDYGDANSTLSGLMTLLGLLPAAATIAVTHYIAHFDSSGDHARLEGLLRGCRGFLFRLTIVGSVLAMLLVKPLSIFFNYNESLMLVALGCALLGLWAALATALCQGLAWFKRLALIGLLMMLLRVSFGWLVTFKWPSPETAVLATGFSMLAYLILLLWRKDMSLHGTPVSPWSREFAQYFVISAAFVVGGYCFTQGDYLVANKFFGRGELDAYAAAGILARALPMTVAPLLTVLFTSRSSQRSDGIVAEQLKLMGLSTFGLVFGAICLFALRTFCLKLIGRNTPEAADMIGQFSITMVFVGLLQSLAFWALASRWIKISLLYGGLGIGYWLALLFGGKSPAALLSVMPVAAGIAFGALFLVWFIALRTRKIGAPEQS
jgi:hypothetical protein